MRKKRNAQPCQVRLNPDVAALMEGYATITGWSLSKTTSWFAAATYRMLTGRPLERVRAELDAAIELKKQQNLAAARIREAKVKLRQAIS